MFRQLVGLVLLSLAAFGLSPAQADSVYVYQGPPKVEVYEVAEINGSYNGTGVTNLQPTISSSGSRTFYTIRTDVLTNGPVDNIDVVAVCFYSAGNIGSDLGADDACGYDTDATTRSGMIDPPETYDPAHSISMAWTTSSGFRLDDENDVQHSLDTTRSRAQATTQADRTVAGSTVSFTSKRLDFVFALSHAAVNTSDWQIRVVAVSTPTPEASEAVTSEAVREIYSGTCSNQYSDTNQISSDGSRNSSCNTPVQFGVNFFGGFMESSIRDSLDYGQIQENGSSGLKSNLATADYFANDSVSMSISATDFTFGSDDTIPLIQEDASVNGTKQAKMVCNGFTGYETSAEANRVIVGSTVKAFFTDLIASSVSGDSERATSAPVHSCELFYGSGATFGNETYTNTVTLGLYDFDTNTGPNAVGIYGTVTTSYDGDDTGGDLSDDSFSEPTTDATVRPSP